MERTRTQSSSPKTGYLILSQSFRVGFLSIHYYALTMVSAVVVGYLLARWNALKKGIQKEFFDDLAFWTIVIAFLSARAYYVIFYWYEFKNQPWTEVFAIWHGGLAIYGAVIGGALTLLYFAHKKKMPFLFLADTVAIGLPLAQALGRLGNFFNYEAFGAPTNLLWKMFVPLQFRPQGYEQFAYFHPTFAYEMLWNVLVFVILFVLNKKETRRGTLTAAYLLLYSLGRFFIEGIRLDSAFFGPFRGDQLTAVFLIIVALAILIRAYGSQNNKSQVS